MPWSFLEAKPRLSEIAKKDVGVKEIGDNRSFTSKNFELKIRKFGWKPGMPYCAFAGASWLDEFGAVKPSVRSGLARSYIKEGFIKAKDVAKGYVKLDPEANYIAIFKYLNTIKGHFAVVVNWEKITGNTIEANTSGNMPGVARDGDGVYTCKRSYNQLAKLKLEWFVEAK